MQSTKQKEEVMQESHSESSPLDVLGTKDVVLCAVTLSEEVCYDGRKRDFLRILFRSLGQGMRQYLIPL
jgi:hypothetical protein